MNKITLTNGTGIASMALYDTANLPTQWSEDHITHMQNNHTLVRMDLWADGDYTIHLYINQDIPPDALSYCNLTGENADFQPIQTEFTTTGHIRFSGLEYVYQKTDQTLNDAHIPAGHYDINIYEAIPLDLMERKEKEAWESIGATHLKHIKTHARIRWSSTLLIIVSLLSIFVLRAFLPTDNLLTYLPCALLALAIASFSLGIWYSKRYHILQLRQQINQYYQNWEKQQTFGLVATLKLKP